LVSSDAIWTLPLRPEPREPASPLWKIAVETAQKTAAGWKSLEQADLLPKDLRASIQKQILRVAATVK
jgi:hypothetical protein